MGEMTHQEKELAKLAGSAPYYEEDGNHSNRTHRPLWGQLTIMTINQGIVQTPRPEGITKRLMTIEAEDSGAWYVTEIRAHNDEREGAYPNSWVALCRLGNKMDNVNFFFAQQHMAMWLADFRKIIGRGCVTKIEVFEVDGKI